jgi:cytochrome c oxidase subunit 2
VKREWATVLVVAGAMSAVSGAGPVSSGAEVKTFEVTASRFRFEPATIRVAQGDAVQLRLHSADRSHAFAIKAFRVKTLIPRGGETVAVQFIADRAGTFAFTCADYCGTGHSAMKGELVVVGTGN